MKKFFIFIAFTGISLLSAAQACDKTACGPEGTKKEEAVVITTLRANLQSVINKMSQSSLSFDKGISEMKITKGTSDDESLLYISQAVTSVRYELLNKIESSKLISSLKEYKPVPFSTRRQMVSGLKKEIQLLASQTEKL
jgi:K+ transporter